MKSGENLALSYGSRCVDVIFGFRGPGLRGIVGRVFYCSGEEMVDSDWWSNVRSQEGRLGV